MRRTDDESRAWLVVSPSVEGSGFEMEYIDRLIELKVLWLSFDRPGVCWVDYLSDQMDTLACWGITMMLHSTQCDLCTVNSSEGVTEFLTSIREVQWNWKSREDRKWWAFLTAAFRHMFLPVRITASRCEENGQCQTVRT